MLKSVFVILFYQLIGEFTQKFFELSIPGPVIGLLLLLFTLLLLKKVKFKVNILTKDLSKGSVSFNLGEIDTPAILFNKIPNFEEWNFQKKITLPLKKDDNVYIKIKQRNNQICWTSPFFIK